jgi:membrane protein required for colicin V production
MLGPIDRLLGFGFGAVKGAILMVLGFSLLVFAYDVVWGVGPAGLDHRRRAPIRFLNAASEELVSMIAERREAAAKAADDDADAPAPEATPAHKKAAHHRKRATAD